MPLEYNLLPEKNLVHTRVYGPVSKKDFMDHVEAMKALFSSGTLDESWMQLIHYDEMTYSGTSPLEMARLLAKNNPWPRVCPRVIVTDHKLIYGLARMYQQLTDPDREGTVVLRKLEDAEDYLRSIRLQRNL